MSNTILYRTLDELTPTHWQRGSVEANGLHLHYVRTGGDKTPLLLLHGFQMNGITWMRVAKSLEGEYDLIMPDARGHGATGSGGKPVLTLTMVEDAAALIQALNLGPVLVIGHSMGADIAGRLAERYPELVQAVVLVDPALQMVNAKAWMESDGYKAWFNDWIAYLEKMREQSHEERVAATLARQMPGITPTHEEDFVTHMEASLLLDMGMLYGVTDMHEGTTPLMEVLVNARHTPKLVLLAQPPKRGYGFSNRVADRDELMSRWENGEVIIFEETGHFIQGERLEQFLETVRPWLKTASSHE